MKLLVREAASRRIFWNRSLGPSRLSLLLGRGPSAIAWFVVAIVVDAVKGHAGWSWSHVGKEVLKRSPRRRNRYASPPVVGPLLVMGVATALQHRPPRVPLGCPGLHVRAAQRADALALEAAATSRLPSTQFGCIDHNLIATSAITSPPYAPMLITPDVLNNEEPSEALSSQVNLRGHRVTSGVWRQAVPAALPPPILQEVIYAVVR